MKRINHNYAVIILALFIFIFINIPYKTSVPYTDTEYYSFDEPYIDLNYYNYTVNESYIEDVPIDYIVLDAHYSNSVSPSPSHAWVTIKNNDTINGYFNVDFKLLLRRIFLFHRSLNIFDRKLYFIRRNENN